MPNLDQIDKDDPGFVADIIKSETSVFAVARTFIAQGADVYIPGRAIRSHIEDRSLYADSCDFEFRGSSKIWRKAEVKHRPDLDFTSPEDFPFPTVFVDRAHKIETRGPTTTFIVNKSLTFCFIIRPDTQPNWVKVEKYDTHLKRKSSIYECPKHLCRFMPITYA